MDTAPDRFLKDPPSLFGEAEALKLHQLRLLEWTAIAGRRRFADEEPPTAPDAHASIPDTWVLTKGVHPLSWQQECMATWRHKGGRGTVKVVTGAGKTLLALFIAERLHNTEDRELRLAIVVPTIVLMHQWYEAILEH